MNQLEHCWKNLKSILCGIYHISEPESDSLMSTENDLTDVTQIKEVVGMYV
jgi:hypothetical protein